METPFLEQIYYITVRIEVETHSGHTSIGSGFVYIVNETKVSDNKYLTDYILVTNEHVINDAKITRVFFHECDNEGNLIVGKFTEIEIDMPDHWIKLENQDIAFMGLYLPLEKLKRNGIKPYVIGIHKDLFVKKEDWINIMPGSEILMVGYPLGIYDHINNLPLLRKGIISSIPNTDFKGHSQFVIDCACFKGSSGSPVFLANIGYKLTRGGIEIGTWDFKFLGIMYGGPVDEYEGNVTVSINMGYCIKSFVFDEIDKIYNFKLKSNSENPEIAKLQQQYLNE